MDKLRLYTWRPHTTIILIIGLVAVLVWLTVSFMVSSFKPTTEVRLGSGVYALALADSEAELVKGLSGVDTLNPNQGLLMQFDTDDKHGIWMKDMLIPLDIVWLNSNKKVIYIVKDAQPENPVSTVYTPKNDARYVIELPAGSVKKAGIKNGDIAEFHIDV